MGDGYRCCACLVVSLLLTGLAVFLGVYLTGADSPTDLLPEDFIPTLEDFFNEDPFKNTTGPEDANRWANNGEGLQLELVNALDTRWDPYFVQAVDDWETGKPDTLTLSTATAPPDPDCTPIDGVMKVCNGNYGDTSWKGINICIIQGGRILNSVAKMNEYYLTDRASDAEKQYTMCHEIGHGFGLPHTDEKFRNPDSGECMDYTRNPQNNMQPGPPNFEFLQAMYGTVPETVASEEASPGNRQIVGFDEHKNEIDSSGLPDWVLDAWEDLVPTIEQSADGREHQDGWRLLHSSLHGTLHEIELGDGYILRVHKLFVPDE